MFTLGNHLSYSSLQTEESRVITQLTIDARAAQEGEVENRIHSSPKGYFSLCFCCGSIVLSYPIASEVLQDITKRGAFCLLQ